MVLWRHSPVLTDWKKSVASDTYVAFALILPFLCGFLSHPQLGGTICFAHLLIYYCLLGTGVENSRVCDSMAPSGLSPNLISGPGRERRMVRDTTASLPCSWSPLQCSPPKQSQGLNLGPRARQPSSSLCFLHNFARRREGMGFLKTSCQHPSGSDPLRAARLFWGGG